MSAAHTPGPWTVDGDDREGMEWNNQIIAANGNTICFMAHSDGKAPERDQANARLIAAAHEMLEALEAANAALKMCAKAFVVESRPENIPAYSAAMSSIAENSAVIAKATGGAS